MAFLKRTSGDALVAEHDHLVDAFLAAQDDLAARAAARRAVITERLAELESESRLLTQLRQDISGFGTV
jgi:hypothetical protein